MQYLLLGRTRKTKISHVKRTFLSSGETIATLPIRELLGSVYISQFAIFLTRIYGISPLPLFSVSGEPCPSKCFNTLAAIKS